MSDEEEKVLKDLVTQCLATKGFLGKIQAEIRAGVFVALEEQNVLKEIFINKSLKDFVDTAEGSLVVSLIREFLEFFNLQFTSMVFDPETHAGIDYKFEGRMKLAKDLNLSCDEGKDLPLLGLLLQSFNAQNHKSGGVDCLGLVSGSNDTYSQDMCAANESLPAAHINGNQDAKVSDDINGSRDIEPQEMLNLLKNQSNGSLLDLSPMNGNNPPLSDNSSSKIEMNDLKKLLQYEPEGGDCHYDEDFVSSGSEKKDKSDSVDNSEIEEDLPSHSNRSTGDEITVDVSVSKESGQGDYTEKISNG